MIGRRNRTLHLYEMTWPTNLLVLGFSRANADVAQRVDRSWRLIETS